MRHNPYEQPTPRVIVIQVDDLADETRCALCGEPADNEMGEFWVRPDVELVDRDGKPIAHENERGSGLLAHGQCGIDHGLELA